MFAKQAPPVEIHWYKSGSDAVEQKWRGIWRAKHCVCVGFRNPLFLLLPSISLAPSSTPYLLLLLLLLPFTKSQSLTLIIPTPSLPPLKFSNSAGSFDPLPTFQQAASRKRTMMMVIDPRRRQQRWWCLLLGLTCICRNMFNLMLVSLASISPLGLGSLLGLVCGK